MMQGGQASRGTQQPLNAQRINQFTDMFNMIKNSGNPNMIISQLASKNPIVANVMNVINQYGGDSRKAFYSEASKAGIDPNQILNMLNRSGQTM